jgi:hypothetical protein
MGVWRVALVLSAGCGRLGFGSIPEGPAVPDVDASPSQSQSVANAPTAGLVAYWPFETATSDAAGTNDATCTNCPTYGPGVVGNAAMFTGNECLTIASMQSWAVPTFTLSAWVQAPNMSGPIIAHESSNGCPSPEMGLTNGVGLVQLNTSDASHNEAWMPTAIASPADWHQVAVSWDGTTQEVFVDGQCACNLTQTLGPLNNPMPFTIGCYPGAGTTFTGAIDEVRIYDRVLTHAEVAGLYAVGGLVAPTPIACSIACAPTPP